MRRLKSSIRRIAVLCLISICYYCCVAHQHDTSLQPRRLVKGAQKISRTYGNIDVGKQRKSNRIKKFNALRNRLEQNFTKSNIDASTSTDKTSRQNDNNSTTSIPSAAPVSTKNDKGGSNKVPTTINTTFTVSPAMVPVQVIVPEPTPAPIFTITTNTSKPTTSPHTITTSTIPTISSSNKPILSVPLGLSILSPSSYPSVEPSVAPVITIKTVAPASTAFNLTNGTSTGNTATSTSTTSDDPVTSTSNSTNEHSGLVISAIVAAVVVSMLLSIVVLKSRLKYVQKYGAATTRSRKQRQQLQQVEIVNDIALDKEKTLHIISSTDNNEVHNFNNDRTSSPDQTIEIRLDDDMNISSQEDSFLSSSEQDTDLDEIVPSSKMIL